MLGSACLSSLSLSALPDGLPGALTAELFIILLDQYQLIYIQKIVKSVSKRNVKLLTGLTKMVNSREYLITMPKRNTSSLSQELSQILQEDILFGKISPGQKIPSQRVLAERYQLSRATVREAIQDLELRGLVETYQGGGTVCRNLLETHFDLPLEGIGDNFEFQVQVMEMRAALEGEAAFYAAQRATDSQLERIDQEYQMMQARSSGNTTLSKAKADLRFHMMIAEASHHLLVISFSQIFYSRYFNAIYGVLDRTLKKFGRYPDGISSQHSQINQALQSREADTARKVAIEHIDYTRCLLMDTE